MTKKDEEKMREELSALGREIYERRQKIISEWKKTHKMPLRGRCAPEEQRELDREEKLRFGEILAKYKDK